MNFLNTLGVWPWVILGIIPPAIVALYFLKLRRRPVEVPSTYLWRRSIEDLHVNSLWQRLRRNLLLLLQLIILTLLILALLRPSWRGEQLAGERFVLLIDNSASMSATDVDGSRLSEAKRRAIGVVDRMQSGDVAMIVSFSDTAEIVQSFTTDRGLLRRRIDAVTPTDRRTSIDEALKVIAGATNSRGRQAVDRPIETPGASPTAESSIPTTLYLISDGRFPEVDDVQLKNTEAVFLPVGRKQTGNVAVMAFAVRRHETDPTRLQAIARLRNFGPDEAVVELDLLLGEDNATRPEDGRLIDAARMTIPPDEQRGAAFDIGGVEQGVLWLTASTGDVLAADDRAQVVVSSSRRARVLLVTPGDESLELAFSTDAARRRAELIVQPPSVLESDDYRRAAATGAYDLIVYDRCPPERMPQSNTWLLGAAPPGGTWLLGERRDVPQVIDVATAHPLLAWAGVADVLIIAGRPIEPPPAADVLIDTDVGPMMAVGTRGMFQDLVTGFSLIEQAEGDDGKMQNFLGTNWQWRPSFPVFVMNLLEYLGGADSRAADTTIRPGEPVVIDTPGTGTELTVLAPDGERHTLTADASGRATVTRTEQLGVYRVETDGQPLRHFAVNLLDATESRIATTAAESVQLGTTEAVAQTNSQPARRETWRWWLLAGLIVATGEWWIYNRRVYL